MSGKVQRLAEVYGPSVRFTPDGNEGDDSLDKAIEGADKASKTPEEQKAIDDQRKSEQQIEQERANTLRANEAARQAQATATAAQASVAEIQAERDALAEKLATAEAKATEAGIEDVKLDPEDYDGSDLKLMRAIQSVKQQIESKDKRIAGLEKKAQTFEQNAITNAAKTESQSQYDELLKGMDEDYGPDCRNEALEKFNELRAAGKVNTNRPSLATRTLEKCYQEVKTAKDKADPGRKKKKVDLDMGDGGGSGVNLGKTEIKEGSLDDVAKQYAATGAGSAKPGD